ncbi:MAG: ATP-binding protein [Nanoarchaeota archaeon]
MQWFEQLDFDDNPFKDTEETNLIGYESTVNEILYNIDAGNLIFVEGENGSGKTALLKKAIKQFRGHGKVLYLDCEKIKALNIEKIIEKRKGFIAKLIGEKPRRMILLMDNTSELDKKNTERLKYFYDQDYIKSVIFTGENMNTVHFSDSLVDRLKKVIKIPEVSKQQAYMILKDRIKSDNMFSQEVAQELFKRSQNVKMFLQNAEELAKRAVENKGKSVTIEMVDSILPQSGVKIENTKEVFTESDVMQLGEEIIDEDPAEKYY